jgi:hypothetical protein
MDNLKPLPPQSRDVGITGYLLSKGRKGGHTEKVFRALATQMELRIWTGRFERPHI